MDYNELTARVRELAEAPMGSERHQALRASILERLRVAGHQAELAAQVVDFIETQLRLERERLR